MFCKHCGKGGKAIKEGGTFCGGCGNEIETKKNASGNAGNRKPGAPVIVIAVLLLAAIVVGGACSGQTTGDSGLDDQNYNILTDREIDIAQFLPEMENNETAAIAGLIALGSAQRSYSTANNGRYANINHLIGGGFVDGRYEAPVDGYVYGMDITPGMPENVADFGAYGAFTATPVNPGRTGRYRFGLSGDMAVRYLGLAEGVVADAPVCGDSPCRPGDALGRTQPAVSITLAAGTTVVVRPLSTISTEAAESGQEFSAVLSENITSDGRIVAREGSLVNGVISAADSGGPAKGAAQLSIRITRLTLADGQTVSVATNEHTARGAISKDATRVAIEEALKVSSAATGGAAAAPNIGALTAAQSSPAVVAREIPVTFRLTSALTATMKNTD